MISNALLHRMCAKLMHVTFTIGACDTSVDIIKPLFICRTLDFFTRCTFLNSIIRRRNPFCRLSYGTPELSDIPVSWRIFSYCTHIGIASHKNPVHVVLFRTYSEKKQCRYSSICTHTRASYINLLFYLRGTCTCAPIQARISHKRRTDGVLQ